MAKRPTVRSSVGYVRVSSFRQDRSGISLEEQKRRIEAWAAGQGLSLERIYEDGAESAKDLDRPKVQEILSRIKAGEVERLVVYKLDRLTRSVRDLYSLIQIFSSSDTSLCSVTESLDTASATGRMTVGMIGLFAQWEREMIAERTIMAMDAKRRRGERLGGKRPFGWKFDGKMLVPVPEERRTLDWILVQIEGRRTYTWIAAELNADKVKSATGGRWYASSVRAVVLRDRKSTP